MDGEEEEEGKKEIVWRIKSVRTKEWRINKENLCQCAGSRGGEMTSFTEREIKKGKKTYQQTMKR